MPIKSKTEQDEADDEFDEDYTDDEEESDEDVEEVPTIQTNPKQKGFRPLPTQQTQVQTKQIIRQAPKQVQQVPQEMKEVTYIPTCVSKEEMFNIINAKLDLVLSELKVKNI